MKPRKSKMCEVCEARGVKCRCNLCNTVFEKDDLIEMLPPRDNNNAPTIYLCLDCYPTLYTSLYNYFETRIKETKTLDTIELIAHNIKLLEKHANKKDEFYLKELKFLAGAIKELKKDTKGKEAMK